MPQINITEQVRQAPNLSELSRVSGVSMRTLNRIKKGGNTTLTTYGLLDSALEQLRPIWKRRATLQDDVAALEWLG